MNIYQFKQINGFAHLVQKQSNTRHLSWIKQFGERLQTEIIGQLGASVPALLSQAIAQYQAAADHEDECYLIISKSELTPQIAALDDERDTKYVGTYTARSEAQSGPRFFIAQPPPPPQPGRDPATAPNYEEKHRPGRKFAQKEEINRRKVCPNAKYFVISHGFLR